MLLQPTKPTCCSFVTRGCQAGLSIFSSLFPPKFGADPIYPTSHERCTIYRTIDLVSLASKILLWIILDRIRVKTETEIAVEQAGFRQGRGTREKIMNLGILMHKAREHQQPLYMCFVDFKNAFRLSPMISSG